MERQDIKAAVERIVSIVLKREFADHHDISRENTAEWDSLKHMEIVFAVEDEFDVQFDEHELSELDSVEKIVSLVEARSAA